MEDSKQTSTHGYHQNPVPVFTFPDFLKILPSPFSPPSSSSSVYGQSTYYEIPKSGESRPLTHSGLPPPKPPNIPLPKTPTQNTFYEIASPTSKGGSRSQVTSADSLTNRSPGQQSSRLSNEISYAQRSGGNCPTDRRSCMRMQNEFSPMQNDLATSLMGSSNDSSREDPNRCFQSICTQGGRRPLNRQKSPRPLFSRIFNEKTAVIYFICFLVLLALLTGFLFFKTTQQYVYSNNDLIQEASPEYALNFGSPTDFVLPSRQITYFELPIQHNTNLALLFNISDSQARFVVYARQTLPPTPTLYSYRRIVATEHLHHRPLKVRRSVTSDDSKQIFEETQVRNSLITLEDVQAGKWFFGFLNDNTRPLQIRLTPVAIPKSDHHPTSTKNHGCKFDCFGKGTCSRNQCICFPGYTGKFCQETLCPILCSGNGVFSNGVCRCSSNFKGPVCDEPISDCPNGHCEAIESRVPEALNANKVLNDPTTAYQQPPTVVAIKPEPTIDNDDVKEENDDKCKNNCNSNGECQMIGNEFKCFCNNTHFGPFCEYPLESDCVDGIDNDEDGLVDCADSECCSAPHCSNHPLCISDLERFVIPTTSQMRPETSFRKQIEFLLGPDSPQKYADWNVFDNSRISVVRGHVLSKRAGPLTGVRISNLLIPKQGFTLTRSSNGGGFFNFVCNGGSIVRFSLLRHPYGAVERNFFVPANQIVDIGQIFLDEEEELAINKNEQCRSAQIAHKFKPKLLTAPISSDNFDLKLQDGTRLNAERRSLEVRSTVEVTNNIQLVYNSDRSTQAHSVLYIYLLDSTPSPNLQTVHLKIKIAGRIYEQTFKAKPNLQYNFAWNRQNVFNQDVVGLHNVIVEVEYEYKDECKVQFMETAQLEGRYLLKTADFGLWTLNIQHYFDAHNQVLERGDGQRVYLNKTPFIVRTLVGNQNQRPENCPDCHNQLINAASLYAPSSIVSLVDGSVVFCDYNLIRRISANGQRIETLLELSAENAGNYQLALDAATNEVYIALQYQILKLKRLEKVRDPKTNQRIVAGTGEPCDETICSTGDSSVKSVRFHQIGGMSFDKRSGFYLLDGRSIRHINRNGDLKNVVTENNWSWQNELQCPSKFRLELLNLQEPRALVVEPLTQDLFVLDRNAIYRINVQQSVVQLIAGKLSTCAKIYKDEGEDLENARQIAFDPRSNYIYLTESDGKKLHRIRRVSANGGKLEEFAGRIGNCDCNRLSCPCDLQPDKSTELASSCLFHNLSAINIDQHGRIFVADTGNFKIKVLEVAQQTFNRNLGVYQIHSPDTNEIYEFDQSGRHLKTRDLFDGQSKYLFTYSTSDGRIINIRTRRMNVTLSAQDSNVLVRTSQSQETAIQMKQNNEDEYQQVAAVSNWRGVHSMFEYGSDQLIRKAKIGQKITQIDYDERGKVSTIEDVNGDKKIELKVPVFDEQGHLHLAMLLNRKEVEVVQESANDLVVLDPTYKKLSTRSSGFELQERGFHRIYERADHPFSSSNDSFTIRHRFVFPVPASDMPKIVLRYELQTIRHQSRTSQQVKLNGQKFISRVFDSDSSTLTLRDPSDNILLSMQLNPTNQLESIQFGSDSDNNASFAYNDFGQTERLNWLDRSILRFYDEQHRLIRQIIRGGDLELVRSFQYDSNSQYPDAVQLEDGTKYMLKYEPDGHLQSIRTPSGNEHIFSRQSNQEIQRTLSSGAQIKAVYNLDGQLHKYMPFEDAENQVQWIKDDFGRLRSLRINSINFGYSYTVRGTRELNVVESDYSSGYFVQGPLLRSIKHGLGNESYGVSYYSIVSYAYDDAARIIQVQTKFRVKEPLKASVSYGYDFMGRLSKLNNVVIIRKEHAIQVIHPNFEMLLTYTLDNQLSGITYTGTSSQTKVSGQFVHNSLSLVNSTLWQLNGETEQMQIFTYKNGKLSSFSLNGEEETVEYSEDGFISKIGHVNFDNAKVNELGWTIEEGNLLYTYDALGQLLQLTNHELNATFDYIYNERQQLIQRRTYSHGQVNITFYYGHSNEPHTLSHFTFDENIFYAIHYVEGRPFLLEQINGSSFALLTDSYGSIWKVVDESGTIAESRLYNPFGNANITKQWSMHLPIGYMGFIEDNGLVFVYDSENQVTRPLNTHTGRFMSYSQAALKTQFDVMNPELETDLFHFDHGRSLAHLFPTDTPQWLQLAGIQANQLDITGNDCNNLFFFDSLCSARQTFNFFGQFFNFNNLLPSFQFLVPVLF